MLSKLIHRTIVATLAAVPFLLVPVAVSPSGQLEVRGVCASTECKLLPKAYCWNSQGLVFNAEPIRPIE